MKYKVQMDSFVVNLFHFGYVLCWRFKYTISNWCEYIFFQCLKEEEKKCTQTWWRHSCAKIRRSYVRLIVICGSIYKDQSTNVRYSLKSFFFYFVWQWFLMIFITNLMRIVTAASWIHSIFFPTLSLSPYFYRSAEKTGSELIQLICVINQCRAIMYFTFFCAWKICHI